MDNFKTIGDAARSVLAKLAETKSAEGLWDMAEKEMKVETVEDVKEILKLAARVDRALPPVRAQGAKALWPDIRLTDSELKAIRCMTRDGIPDFMPTQEQVDIWYLVCTQWVKFFAGDEKKRQQWTVIWLKACGCRVKTIARHVNFGRTKIWYQYERGMAHLLNSLQVNYIAEDLKNLEPYKPELVRDYPVGKITGATKINVLKEWLAELEGAR